MLHETPNRFGKDMSQSIMGIQMATAYVGNTLMPSLFGVMGKYISFDLFPYFLFILIFIMFISSERITRIIKK